MIKFWSMMWLVLRNKFNICRRLMIDSMMIYKKLKIRCFRRPTNWNNRKKDIRNWRNKFKSLIKIILILHVKRKKLKPHKNSYRNLWNCWRRKLKDWTFIKNNYKRQLIIILMLIQTQTQTQMYKINQLILFNN